MDYPSSYYHKPVISSYAFESLGRSAAQVVTVASATWPAANRALFLPFTITAPYLVQRVWWANGATVNGNVDCGIYSSDGTKLASVGSTAQVGTSVVQSVALAAPLLLLPGSYYMALVLSSATATVIRTSAAVAACQMMGMAQQATALPLPATATFATIASAALPLFGITSSTVI